MKVYYKQILKVLSLTVIAVLFAGCFKDDNTSCPRSVNLRFVYTHNPDDVDKFEEYMNKLTMFVYNEDGAFMFKQDIDADDLDSDNRYKLDIIPGNYRIVFWAYDDDNYEVYEGNDIEVMRTQLKCNPDNTVSECTPLLHSYNTVEVFERNNREVTVPFTNNTNQIHIILDDVTGSKPEGIAAGIGTRVCPNTNLSVRISGINTIYTYDNAVAEEAASKPATFLPYYDVEEYLADFSVLRLFDDDSDQLQLTIYDPEQDRTVYDLRLTEEIIRTDPRVNTTFDLDKYYEYTVRFELKYEEYWVVTGVYINDWEMTSSSGGI